MLNAVHIGFRAPRTLVERFELAARASEAESVSAALRRAMAAYVETVAEPTSDGGAGSGRPVESQALREPEREPV
jgi:hypothetical protein